MEGCLDLQRSAAFGDAVHSGGTFRRVTRVLGSTVGHMEFRCVTSSFGLSEWRHTASNALGFDVEDRTSIHFASGGWSRDGEFNRRRPENIVAYLGQVGTSLERRTSTSASQVDPTHPCIDWDSTLQSTRTVCVRSLSSHG